MVESSKKHTFMKNLKFAVLAFILLGFASSCQRIERECDLWIMAKWVGREIVLPSFLPNDSANHKILVLVREGGCTSCQLQISRWVSFMDELHKLSGQRIPVLFCFHSIDTGYVDALLRGGGYNGPYYIDSVDSLNFLNGFNEKHSVFLLDRNNCVELVGNPVTNSHIGNLFLSQILSHPKADLRSKIKNLELGVLRIGERVKTKITISNYGLDSFAFQGIETSCDCVTASMSELIIPPGRKAKLKINISPNAEGDFTWCVDIKGLDDVSLQIFISATVVGL